MQRPIYPNLFQFDSGQMIDLDDASGLGVAHAGQEQNRQRRAAIMDQNSRRQQQPGFGPLRGLFDGLGLGSGGSDWDAYFGTLQGKENAVHSQGGKLNWDADSWGAEKTEPMYRPTWDPTYQDSALSGLRRTGIVPNRRGGR